MHGLFYNIALYKKNAKICLVSIVFNHMLCLSFTAEGSNTSEAEIFGIIAGIPVKFNMPNPNGCSQSGLVCPLKPSMEYTYTSQFLVLKSYPNVSILIKYRDIEILRTRVPRDGTNLHII